MKENDSSAIYPRVDQGLLLEEPSNEICVYQAQIFESKEEPQKTLLAAEPAPFHRSQKDRVQKGHARYLSTPGKQPLKLMASHFRSQG